MIILVLLFLKIALNNELLVLYPGEIMSIGQEQDNQCGHFQKEIILINEQFDGEILHITQNPFNQRSDIYYMLQVFKGAEHYYQISEITLISYNKLMKNLLIKISSAFCQNMSFKQDQVFVIPCKTSLKWTIYVYSIETNKLQSYNINKMFGEEIIKIYVGQFQPHIFVQSLQTVYRLSYKQNKIQAIYNLNCTIETGSLHRQFIGFACKNHISLIFFYQEHLKLLEIGLANITQMYFISPSSYLLISDRTFYSCLDNCHQIDNDVEQFQDTVNQDRLAYKKQNQIYINNSKFIRTQPLNQQSSFYYNFNQNILIIFSQRQLQMILIVKFPFYLMHSRCIVIKNHNFIDFQLFENKSQIIRNWLLQFPRLNYLDQINKYLIQNYWIGINLQYTVEQMDNQQFISTSYEVEILKNVLNFTGQGLFVQKEIVMVLNSQQIQQYGLNKQMPPKLFQPQFELKYTQDYLNFNQHKLVIQQFSDDKILIFNYTDHSFDLIYQDEVKRMFINSFIIIYENTFSMLTICRKEDLKYNHQFLLSRFGLRIEQVYYDQYAEQIVVLEQQKLRFFIYISSLNQVNTIELDDYFINCYFYKEAMIIVYQQKIQKYQRIQNHKFHFVGYIDILEFLINKESIIIQEEIQYLYIQNDRQLLLIDISQSIKNSLRYVIAIKKDLQIQTAYKNWVWFQQGDSLIGYIVQPSIEIKLNYLNNFHNLNLRLNICAQNIYDKQCEVLTNRIYQSYFIIQQQLWIIRYRDNKITIPQIFEGLVENIRIDKYDLLQKKTKVMYKAIQIDNFFLNGQIHQGKFYIFSYDQVSVFDLSDFKLLRIIQFDENSRYYALKNDSIIQFGLSKVQIVKCLHCETEILIQQFNFSIYEPQLRIIDQFIVLFANQRMDLYRYNELPKDLKNTSSIICFDIYKDIIVYVDEKYQLFVLNQQSYNLSEFFQNNDIIPYMPQGLNIDIHILNTNIDVLLIVNGEGIYIIRLTYISQLKTILCISQKYFVFKLQIVLQGNLINVAVHLGTKFAIYQFSQQDINDYKYMFPRKHVDLNESHYHLRWFYGIVNNQYYLIHANNQQMEAIEFNLQTTVETEIQFNDEAINFNMSNSNQFVQMQVYLVQQVDYYFIEEIAITILLITFIILRRRRLISET